MSAEWHDHHMHTDTNVFPINYVRTDSHGSQASSAFNLESNKAKGGSSSEGTLLYSGLHTESFKSD